MYTNQTDITDKIINSDVTMLADKTFHRILEQINNSKLNYHLQLSPFTAWISLKKTFIKDKEGAHVLPSPFWGLEDNVNLQKDYQRLQTDYARALETIEYLKNQITVKSEDEEECQKLVSKCSHLEGLVIKRDQTIVDLQSASDKARETTIMLNKQMNKIKTEFKDEKATLLKEHRTESKLLKKELGQANSKILKLEATSNFLKSKESVCISLKSSHRNSRSVDTNADSKQCGICATQLDNYVQKYFMGNPISPVCKKCDIEDLNHADPFSSFSCDGMPTSMASYWNPFPTPQINSPLASFKCHTVESISEENIRLQEELNKWKNVFTNNLEDMLKKLDAAFTKMEIRIDEAATSMAATSMLM